MWGMEDMGLLGRMRGSLLLVGDDGYGDRVDAEEGLSVVYML